MTDYQPQKNNPYILPRSLYRRMLWLVRDYDRIKTEWHNIPFERPTPDGMPRGSDVSDPTARMAMRREILFKQLEAVDQGIFSVPEEYRRGVLAHVKYGTRWPDYADRKTWFGYQSMFICAVAKRMNEI